MTLTKMVADLGAVLDWAWPDNPIEDDVHAYTESLGLPRVGEWCFEGGALSGHVASSTPLDEMYRIVQKYADALGDGRTGVWDRDGHRVLYASVCLASYDGHVMAWLGRWSR